MKYLVISKLAERREEMKSILKQLDRGAQTSELHDWQQADTALENESRDLVVADVYNVEGQRQALLMLERHPRQLIALLSDPMHADDTLALIRAGVRAVISRDLDWRAIIRALELVLLGEYYVPAAALHNHPYSAQKPARHSVAESRLPYRRRLIDSSVLSPRQRQIMRLVHMGSTNKGIARALGISEGTVKIHLATVFKLLGASNRAAAVAIYNGWLFDQQQIEATFPHHRPPFPGLSVLPHPRVQLGKQQRQAHIKPLPEAQWLLAETGAGVAPAIDGEEAAPNASPNDTSDELATRPARWCD